MLLYSSYSSLLFSPTNKFVVGNRWERSSSSVTPWIHISIKSNISNPFSTMAAIRDSIIFLWRGAVSYRCMLAGQMSGCSLVDSRKYRTQPRFDKCGSSYHFCSGIRLYLCDGSDNLWLAFPPMESFESTYSLFMLYRALVSRRQNISIFFLFL